MPPPWERRVGEGACGRGSRMQLGPAPQAPAAAQTLSLPGPCWISMINTAIVTDSVASPALVSQAF